MAKIMDGDNNDPEKIASSEKTTSGESLSREKALVKLLELTSGEKDVNDIVGEPGSELKFCKTILQLKDATSHEGIEYEYGDLPRKHGWLFWLLTHEGPVTDSRLKVPIEGPGKEGSKAHIPSSFPHPAYSGESTSWTFEVSEELIKIWEQYRKAVIKAIDSATNYSELNSNLEQILELINSSAESQLTELTVLLQKVIPGFDREKLIVADSGSNALTVARDLLTPGSHTMTTKENGSFFLKQKNLEAIYLRDKKTNNTFSTEELLSQWNKESDEYDSKFYSITMASKSGLRFDQENGFAVQLLEQVREYNKTNLEDPKVVVLDLVQLVGRVDLDEAFKLVEQYKDVIAGVVFTGSKAPGGASHAGVLTLTDFGVELLERRKVSESAEEDDQDLSIEGLIDTHNIMGAKILGQDSSTYDPITTMRVRSNVNAIISAYDNETGELLEKERYEMFGRHYQNFFKLLGFKLLGSDLDSSIPMEPPNAGIDGVFSAEDINEKFLTYLAKNGASMGGFLQEGDVPILRWGVSEKLAKDTDIKEKDFLEVLYGDEPDYNLENFSTEISGKTIKEKLTILSSKSGLVKIFAEGLLRAFTEKSERVKK